MKSTSWVLFLHEQKSKARGREQVTFGNEKFTFQNTKAQEENLSVHDISPITNIYQSVFALERGRGCK